MSKRKNIWTIDVIEKNRYTVSFDTPVTEEEATWQYEAQDDNIIAILDQEYLDFLDVTNVQ